MITATVYRAPKRDAHGDPVDDNGNPVRLSGDGTAKIGTVSSVILGDQSVAAVGTRRDVVSLRVRSGFRPPPPSPWSTATCCSWTTAPATESPARSYGGDPTALPARQPATHGGRQRRPSTEDLLSSEPTSGEHQLAIGCALSAGLESGPPTRWQALRVMTSAPPSHKQVQRLRPAPPVGERQPFSVLPERGCRV